MGAERETTEKAEFFSSNREQWLYLAVYTLGPIGLSAGVLMPKPAGWVVVALAVSVGVGASLWTLGRARKLGGGRWGARLPRHVVKIGDREYERFGNGELHLVLSSTGRRINLICLFGGLALLVAVALFGEPGTEPGEGVMEQAAHIVGVVLFLGALSAPTLNALVRRLWRRARRSGGHEPIGTDPERP